MLSGNLFLFINAPMFSIHFLRINLANNCTILKCLNILIGFFMYYRFQFSLLRKDKTTVYTFFWGEQYHDHKYQQTTFSWIHGYFTNQYDKRRGNASVKTISAASCTSFRLTIWHSSDLILDVVAVLHISSVFHQENANKPMCSGISFQ